MMARTLLQAALLDDVAEVEAPSPDDVLHGVPCPRFRDVDVRVGADLPGAPEYALKVHQVGDGRGG